MDALEREVTRLTSKLPAATNNVRKFGRTSAYATKNIGGFGVAISGVLGPIAALTTGLAGLTAGFTTLANQNFFEAKVRSLGVNSDELLVKLQAVSKELKGQASVVELTGAAYDVASAGFNNAADASQVLKAASLGAVGGFSDINTVANATTSVLNAYGLSADKAGQLVDGFIQTQNDGKIVLDEYARNIGKLAPIAASLKVPLGEVNAAIAAVTANGVNAEIGITGIRSALAKLGANSKDATEILAKYGVEINATTIGSEGLYKTLQKLAKITSKEDLLRVVGVEAGQAIAPLLNDLPKLERLIRNQADAAGVAQKANDEAANTIKGAWKEVQTAFQNLFSSQSAAAEAIIPILQGVADAINAINTPAGMLAVKIAGVTVAVIALNKAVAALKATALVGWFQRLIPILAAGKGAFAAKAVAVAGLNKALVLVKTTMATMPWAAAAAAIGFVAVKTYEAVAAKKSFEETLRSVDRAIVESKIKQLEEDLKKVEEAAAGASGGMSMFGGSMGAASLQAAQLRTQIAQLKGELAGLPQNYTVGGITYDWKTGQAINAPAFEPPGTGGGGGGGAGGGGGGGAADTLQQQMKAGQELSRQFEQQKQLLMAKNELETALLTVKHQELDVMKQIQETAAASQQAGLIAQAQEIAQLERKKAIAAYAQDALDEAQALIDSTYQQIEADARREELIAQGINPALADSLIAIEKQFEPVKKILDEKILTLETTIEQFKAEGKVTEELQKQLDLIKKRRGELDKAEGDAKDGAKKEDPGKIEQYMKQLESDLMDTEGMIVSLAQTVESELGSAMSNAISGIIDGTMTAEEAFAQMFKNIGKAFIDMATQMIAKALVMKVLGIAFGGGGGGGGFGGGYFDPMTGLGTAGPNFGLAEGGFITEPTAAMVGEGGDNEYVIPEDKMSSALQRYNSGARGDAVTEGANGVGGDDSSAWMDAPINISTGPVMAFEGKNYVTQDEFAAGVQSAAKQGEARALRKLQMSPAARRRAGVS